MSMNIIINQVNLKDLKINILIFKVYNLVNIYLYWGIQHKEN